MKWFLLLIAVASLLSAGRPLWKWFTGSAFHDLNEDSARRRLAALMPPIGKEQR